MEINLQSLLFFLIIGYSSANVSFNITNEMKNEGEQLWKHLMNLQEDDVLTATVNDYADKIVLNMGKLMLRKELDPLHLPDVEEKISRKILLITYWGMLKLSEIQLQQISTITRKGDASVNYDMSTKQMTIEIPLQFKEIKFDTRYKAVLMGLGPSGRITGEMKDLRMSTSITMDFEYWQAIVNEYKITHSGHISVHFHEFILVNWLLDILANTVTTIFKGLIIDVIDEIVKDILDNIVDVINTLIDDITNYFPENQMVAKDGVWTNAMKLQSTNMKFII